MVDQSYTQFGGTEITPCDMDQATIVILPLCYENAPSYGTGSSEGPLHILEASTQLEGMDEETGIEWSIYRIHTCPPLKPSQVPEKAVRQMAEKAHAILVQGKRLISLGGDHAISIGPIKTAAELFPHIGVLQVDAHLDLRDTWNGSPYNHACVMRRVVEDIKLPIVQVGIRSFSKEEALFVERNHLSPIYAHGIDHLSNRWIDHVLDRLPEEVYFTIDLDGLDPSIIPGTGTPEPGGLSYRQLLSLIKAVGSRKKVIAADINELVKLPNMQVSEFTAAKIATKLMVHCFAEIP